MVTAGKCVHRISVPTSLGSAVEAKCEPLLVLIVELIPQAWWRREGGGLHQSDDVKECLLGPRVQAALPAICQTDRSLRSISQYS